MTLREKVEEALQKVRPSLQADGGDVQLVDVDDNGIVKVRLMGACGGCPMSQMTLKSRPLNQCKTCTACRRHFLLSV